MPNKTCSRKKLCKNFLKDLLFTMRFHDEEQNTYILFYHHEICRISFILGVRPSPGDFFHIQYLLCNMAYLCIMTGFEIEFVKRHKNLEKVCR